MRFKKAKGLPGKIYEPEKTKIKKHNCRDCFSCQMCTDARCELCLKRNKCLKKEK